MSAKELNIGDYVRTLEYIRKIRKIKDNYVYCDIGVFEFNEIIKSSPNIIDLVQEGDYVNGCKIIELATNIDGKVLYLETDITEFDNVYACGNINIYEKDIKSIVTKEQFESMEYKIGE